MTLIREPNWVYKMHKLSGENALQNYNALALGL